MPVSLGGFRELLLPGLRMVATEYKSFPVWEELYAPAIEAPHIWVPKLSLPQVVAVGAAAAIIQNPVVTRRFWRGWFAKKQ